MERRGFSCSAYPGHARRGSLYHLTLSLLSCLACGLFIGRGDGTSGQASVRVPIRADMTAAVATRRRAFQYSLMHRQNCENPETRGVITDHVLARSRVTYTQLERRGAHARGRWCVFVRRAVSLCVEYNYFCCAPHVFQKGTRKYKERKMKSLNRDGTLRPPVHE